MATEVTKNKKKSVKKRNRQAEAKRLTNKSLKSKLKTYIKKYNKALLSGDVEQTAAALQECKVQLFKAVSKNLIHKNNAARKTSRMTIKYNKLKEAKADQKA